MENREKKKWLSIYSDLSNKLRGNRALQNNAEFMDKLARAREHAVEVLKSQRA